MVATAMTRTAFLLLPLLIAAFTSATSSTPARLYLHPAAPGKGRAAEISPIQANHILTHLLDVPGETLGASGSDRDAWDWIHTNIDGKKAVHSLFDDSTQKSVVLFTDLNEEDAQDVFAAQIRHTHQIVSPPHASSFEALIQSYGERIYSAVPVLGEQFSGFFTASLQGVETALEGAAEWLVGDGSASLRSWKKTVDETDFGGEASAVYKQSIKDLVAFFDAKTQSDNIPTFQAIRFSGLGEIKSTYGQDSSQYKRAKEVLRSLLKEGLDQADSMAVLKPRKIAFLVLPEQEERLVARSVDLLSPFRSSLSLTPFLSSRDISENLKNNSNAPKESDFIGKCFAGEDELMKATADCSGHGKAIQSSKGGRKCYRCNCQQTKGKGGNVITWAGAACQKQDISKPFVLLLTTTVGLIFVILGSVAYLFNEGQQELPSVLAGISITNK